jgi:hypothetical protein
MERLENATHLPPGAATYVSQIHGKVREKSVDI